MVGNFKNYLPALVEALTFLRQAALRLPTDVLQTQLVAQVRYDFM
jgi:hypothetical protein